MYVCVYTRNRCMCVYPESMYLCMYVHIHNLCICVCVYVGFSCIYVCGHFYVHHFYAYRISNFMFSGPSCFIKIPLVKVVDFNAGEVMRGHGHFWWIYPLGARFRYGASLLDFHHAFGLIQKNISFC